MLYNEKFPVIEHDDSWVATLNPQDCGEGMFDADRLVITFFPEVIDRMLERGEIVPERVVSGENPITIHRFAEQPDVLVTLGQVGCPACGGNLDLFCAMGIRHAMFCGGGGVLDSEIGVGEVMLVDGAIRDEGFSYHYVAPSRIIWANPTVNDQIAGYLGEQGIPFTRGLTWTTDAIFRETPDRVARRRDEGARIVEMEQAGCLAVAQFRGLAYGALVYGGDDVSGDIWSGRRWRSREGIRFELVRVCRELVRII